VTRGVQIIAQAVDDVLGGNFALSALEQYAGWGSGSTQPPTAIESMEGR
jgi:hypothetical protein